MRTLRAMPAKVVMELTRLHQQEIAAYETGQMETYVTCRLRWAKLYLEADGVASPAPQLMLTVGNTVQGKRIVSKKRWQESQEARPLVAIKKVRLVTWTDKAGALHYYHHETLACGHEYENFAVDADTPAAKRRKCKQCGSAVMEARQLATEQTAAATSPELVVCQSLSTSRLA